METVNGIVHSQNGRPVIAGCGTLPPVDDDVPQPKALVTGGHSKPKQSKRATAARFAALNGFVDFSMRGLSGVELGTWLVLYRDTKPDGIAATSQLDIARRIGASDRAVRSAVRQLAKLGLLVVVRRGGLQRGPSRYRVWGTEKPPS